MIAYNNFYHLVEVKRTKKFGAQIWAFFLLFSQAWFISYLLNCIGDSLEQFLDTSRGKLHKKKWDVQIWAIWAKIGPKIRFFTIF